MASKTALLLSLNLLFFTVVSSTCVPCGQQPQPPKGPKHPPAPKPPSSHPPPKGPKHPPHSKPPHSKPPSTKPPHSHPPPSKPPPSIPPPSSPPPTKPPPSKPPPTKPPPSSPPPTKPPPSKPPPSSPPPTKPPPSKQPSCPLDTLKLGVCADLLNLVNVQLGNPANSKCCSLIKGVTDLEAAVCLCTALRANVLGINLNVTVDLSLILNTCGKGVPKGFECPPPSKPPPSKPPHSHPPPSKPPPSKPPPSSPPPTKPPPSSPPPTKPPPSSPPPTKPPPSSPPPTKPPPSKPPPSSPPPTKPPPSKQPSCPLDTLKLGVCADLLNLVNVVIGNPSNTKCCSLIQGLTDLDAAICLCTALRANVLGINLNITVDLSLILNTCGKGVPKGFTCS